MLRLRPWKPVTPAGFYSQCWRPPINRSGKRARVRSTFPKFLSELSLWQHTGHGVGLGVQVACAVDVGGKIIVGKGVGKEVGVADRVKVGVMGCRALHRKL